MRVAILGEAEASRDGAAVDLGSRKQRALLAALALHRGRPVPVDTIVDLVWADAPPTALTATLQGYVARLRRALEPGRALRGPSEVLVTRGGGYALALPEADLDSGEFESAVSGAHAVLGTVVLPQPSLAEAGPLLEQLQHALGLWRGTPFAELEDAPAAMAERARLEELRAIALEDRAVAGLALGRHATVAAELEVLTTTHPLRERLWGLRALALARSGRQADALEALREVRELLADELGLEPGADLRRLQTAVLRQDPELEWSGRGPAPVAVPAPSTPPASDRPPPLPDPRRSPGGLPLVGRDDQLAALVGLLEQSVEAPAFAALTGEPGIGKSRLCAELAAVARAQGVEVLVGRCSQDEGAPPLYPWAAVLSALGAELPSSDSEAEDGAARFGAWEAITGTLLESARQRPLLLVLDDLHWADTSTLRVLRLLTETADAGGLMVVCTWRHQPAPTGQLAVVADMLARRHALRLELAGLTADEVAEVVTSVAEDAPTVAEADALRARTDGNPFFLVEYARLAREGGDLTALLAEEHPPAAVNDVISRRLSALPEATLAALRVGCVVGREFDLATLAALLGLDEDEVLERLEPALAAGLVAEPGVDRFRFAHALVRDTCYGAVSQSRRGRTHARAAELLEGVAGRESEVARHWLAAGPTYAGRAWRAARTAAAAADAVFAYDESVALLAHGLDALEADPEATGEERFDLVCTLARGYQLTDELVLLRRTVHRALALVEGDVERELRAIGLLVTKALWQTGVWGQVDEHVIAILRRCLDALPPGDSVARCRAMSALATEIYYQSSVQEREALSEQALAMARRLGDDQVLLDTLLAVPMSLWSPATAHQRHALAGEAVELAHRLGDAVSLCVALAQRASAASESGRVDGLLEQVEDTRARATAVRQLFVRLFCDGLEIPWRAMRGELDAVRTLLADMVAMSERIAVPQAGDAVLGAVLMELVWGGRDEELLGMVDALAQVQVLPTDASVALVLSRGGRLEEARARLHVGMPELSADWWFSPLTLAMAAEASLRAGVPEVAAVAYERLAPYAGMPAAGGSGTIVGLVDHFLAMAAHATGEHELATRHADDAVRLCAEWELTLAGEWFAGVRAELGF